MNAERLHAIVGALNEEVEYADFPELLKNLTQKLEQVIHANANWQGNPQQIAKIQQDFAAKREELYNELDSAPTNDFSPSWRQVLTEIGGNDLFGSRLKEKIEKIFQQNQITPAVALEELKQLSKRVEQFETSIGSLINAFETFKIGDEKLAPGQSEIGMLIPRNAVDNKLAEFAEELDEMGFILNTFSEIATGRPDDLSIKTISSSDLTVYLDAGIPFAACLAVAIERIVALYKQVLEIRKLRTELAKQQIPESDLSSIENHANGRIEKGLGVLASEIVEEFYRGKDTPRKHELRNAAFVALKKMASRIDHGYNIEVRVAPPAAEGEKKPDAETSKQVALIQHAAKQMQFLKLEGEPILQLTNGEPKETKPKRKTGKILRGQKKHPIEAESNPQ